MGIVNGDKSLSERKFRRISFIWSRMFGEPPRPEATEKLCSLSPRGEGRKKFEAALKGCSRGLGSKRHTAMRSPTGPPDEGNPPRTDARYHAGKALSKPSSRIYWQQQLIHDWWVVIEDRPVTLNLLMNMETIDFGHDLGQPTAPPFPFFSTNSSPLFLFLSPLLFWSFYSLYCLAHLPPFLFFSFPPPLFPSPPSLSALPV